MSYIVLIDANKYLDFYRTEKIIDLIPIMNQIKDNIMITKQIVDEINRNKTLVFIDATKQLAIPKSINYPSHLLPDEHSDFKDKIKEMNSSLRIIINESKDITNKIFSDISKNEDHVTSFLSSILVSAEDHTDEQIQRARMRKELGNPPGKRNDPLGDQLTWEQFLDNLEGVTEIWIISGDGDFTHKYGGELKLHPFLYSDIIDITGSTVEIKVYDSIALGLKAISDYYQGINDVPSDEIIEEMSQAESEVARYGLFPEINASQPQVCPRCNESGSFTNGAYLRSQYGGLTLQYVCTSCGFHYDTGDYFD